MTKDQRIAIVTRLITEIAVPDVLAFIRQQHQRWGTLPTDADVRAHLATHANGAIARGEALLREHASAKSAI